jgi:hypothetical protein
MLLDRGSRPFGLQRFYIGGDMDRLHLAELRHAPRLTPLEKTGGGARMSRTCLRRGG